ncbi:oligopeptide ABC transporter substrate-binding protein [Virgibacillus pantothenticus]|uniref:oligopeptide ABC transporter substrate-binding protein n=1 Tax=Virgibacillus pantothenticus TaxID=1473 RepID=UPI001C24EE53|nr:oligopeptide ABC transporter substrate-binding protein [Virgibacillus pantothenticus]MBU8567513.1 oligopeptide ABC transporter substrate-binding protein [Virgibacillus pantothenticus]MBU8601125.1 oligopeptide ABC transporter substrate-binding protein [Virgibacillus pantothenticus]MBU8635475.1 oligopeptide ABC transporter substrate-binding protein [Virgibacillus pantothenticus]MBU8643168.1 oligopeptide ABC transporter substrate-binding protein [Virgibacillus pantothenticus]MBU8647391.1 oligo
MKKKVWLFLLIFLSLSLFLVACADTTSEEGEGSSGDEKAEGSGDDAEAKAGEPKKGGTVTFAFTQPFQGLLDRGFYEGEDDEKILRFITDSLVDTNDELQPEPGLADFEVDKEKNTVTFTLKDGITWHDGEPLTTEDVAYAYEVIAHPDYEGMRYTNVNMIEGVEAYNKGKVDSISGIEIVDEKTIVLTLTDVAPNTISNLWSYPMPKHHYEGIEVADLPESDAVRKNPIGTGPFKVKNIVPGEMVEMEKYADYWQGEPYLDGVVYKVIDASVATGSLKNGEIDIMQAPSSQYPEIKKLDNVEAIEEPALSFNYIGFKLGHWDAEKGVNVMDNKKFQNKQLRKAMAYAIDIQGILDSFSNGLGEVIGAPVPPVSWAYADQSELEQYNYDPEKAKELLDEAGYVDVNDDGWREDPDGKEFTVNFDTMSGSDISEPRAQYILQNWQDVGINAKLNGGLKEFNLFYDVLEKDEPSVETFMGAWGLASDPDPTGLWKSDSVSNYARWVNEESDKLIEKGLSDEAFDQEYRKNVYVEWQKLINDELPNIFLYAPVDVYAVNKRLQNVHTNSFTSQQNTHLWWVTDANEE